MPDGEQILAIPLAVARNKQLGEALVLFGQSCSSWCGAPQRVPPEPIAPVQPLCGMGGSWGSEVGPVSLQWVLAMSSPPRSVFLRALFVRFTQLLPGPFPTEGNQLPVQKCLV